MEVVVVKSKEELKAALKKSADVIELQGLILKQYKAYKLLKKYGLPATGLIAFMVFQLKSGKGFDPSSFLKNAAANGDKIDPKLIMEALMVIVPVILMLIPIMVAFSKDYEEIDIDFKNGKFRFNKKSKQ